MSLKLLSMGIYLFFIPSNIYIALCDHVPTNTSTIATSTAAYSSSLSSSSASSEDQLAPLLRATSNAVSSESSSSSSSSCVTCPQTVCTLSKVSYTRKAIHHNWRVDGLPDYIAYLEKFHAPFEMSSEVRFNTTPPNDGDWSFTLTRSSGGSGGGVVGTGRNNAQRHNDDDNSTPLELRVRYRYITNTRSPPKISFDLWLSIHVEDEYVTLPSQISSKPTWNSQSVEHPGKYTWTYLFLWSDIQRKLVTLIESFGLESQLVEFKFVINSYQEGNLSSGDANCQNWTEGVGGGGEQNQQQLSNNQKRERIQYLQGNFQVNSINNATWPPFLHHMFTIMKDDKYTDLTIKSGDDEFQVHRVIAAYGSPLLATMIYNMTYERSESLLDFGEDIGSDVVEELIRYMYTGRVEDIDEIADRLLVAATKYGFPALKRYCESVLIKQVKTENAFSFYELGVEVNSMRLKRRAFNVMKENKSKIVAQSEEFRKLSVHHPDVMYELFLS